MDINKSKIRVISCGDESLWYNDKIGQEFVVSYWGTSEVYVKTGDYYNTGNFVRSEDLEVVKESVPK